MSISEDDYIKLKEVYNHLFNNQFFIELKIKENKSRVKDVEESIRLLKEKENFDYEVFSPRINKDDYKKRILAEEENVDNLEEERKTLEEEYSIIENQVNKLEIIINHMDEDDVLKENDYSDNKKNSIILDIQEMERQRIARDLHDTTVQNLVHLIHKIELCRKYLEIDSVQANMELLSISKNIKDTINDMRDTIFNLRPMEFDDIGVYSAFEKLFMDFKLKTKIEIETEIEQVEGIEEIKAISIFHIIQECCNNAIKHSKAKHLYVTLKSINNQIQIIIRDDGIGFDLEKKIGDRNFGIIMVKERVSLLMGKIDFKSIINKGTNINIVIPASAKL